MLRRLALVCTMSVLGLGTSACQTVALNDTIDSIFDFNFSLLVRDDLTTPYVAGADLTLSTIGPSADDTVGWTIASVDPSVLRIDSTTNGNATATATGSGVAQLSVLDASGGVVHETAAAVRAPDRAVLLAHGPLIVDRPELQADDPDVIRILEGGTGTFMVRWLEGELELHGHGALTARVADAGVTAQPRTTFLGEEREWISFTADEPGDHDVDLFANGQLVRTVTVRVVDTDAIDRVDLHGMDESAAQLDQTLAIIAQAYDAEGNAIYGVEYEWELDGAPQTGIDGGLGDDRRGDVYRYIFDPDFPREVCARFSMFETIANIQARRGYVDSTNRIGCHVGAIGGTGLPGGVLLAPLALLALRRRRR